MSYGDSKIGTPWRGYYITAYGIAVKHGFKGTEEEWLASLQGVDGRSIEIRYNDVTNVLEWKFTDDDAWTQLLDLEQLQTEIVAQTLAQAQAAQQAAEAAQAAAEAAQQEAERNAGITQADTSITQTNVQLSQDAKTAAQAAQAAAEAAQQAAQAAQAAAETAETGAEESATLSKSWAVGGTGTRPGEDTNNAEYWAKQAETAAGGGVMTFNGRTGAVVPQNGDYDPHMVRARPRRNLLRNAFFVGGGSQKGAGNFPVNQKGQTEYAFTTKNIAIDSWALWGVPSTMTLTNDGVIVGKKGEGENNYVIWEQIVDEDIPEGAQLTASALLDNNELITLTIDPGWTYAGDATLKSISYRNETLWIRTTADNHIAVRFYWGSAVALGSTSLYKAAGLEYGDAQTVAYKDNKGQWQPMEKPDYGAELARCQRCLYIPALSTFSTFYYASVNSASGDIFFPVILPVPMRATPAVTAINATLYVGAEQKTVTASAITCYALRGNQALCRVNGVAAGASARTGIVEIGGLQLSSEL